MRILHCVMNLGYGGVESYVARVSRAMIGMGHEVTVLSQGGPMEALLREYGVEVIAAPLNPGNLAGLSSRIAAKNLDVINGHNYNSARPAHVIARKLQIPYVMTVHGPRPFHTKALFRHWSRTVITTSGADKRGITGFLGLRPDRVVRNFLVIDPERYYVKEVSEDVRSQHMEPGTKLIVHISRFTNRKARVALELLRAMPSILRIEPRARLLIVGDGPMRERIAEEVNTLNGHGERVARLVEPRLDLSEIFNLASVVVATATTAMEAMACGAPMIAAGRTGCAGLVDAGSFDRAQDLMFGDHGRCPTRVDHRLLSKHIVEVLTHEEDWREKISGIRDRVSRELTPQRAAEDLIRIYQRVVAESGYH